MFREAVHAHPARAVGFEGMSSKTVVIPHVITSQLGQPVNSPGHFTFRVRLIFVPHSGPDNVDKLSSILGERCRH